MSINAPTPPISPKKRSEDRSLDLALRPKTFAEYIGQEKIKQNLQNTNLINENNLSNNSTERNDA
mgnify:CR=1 FL=1